AALEQYLDRGESHSALMLRRLDRLAREAVRHQRDLEVLSEAFAVYVRLWCAYLPPLSPQESDSARREGAHKYEQFIEVGSGQLAAGERFAPRVAKVDAQGSGERPASGTQGNVPGEPRE